MRLVDVWQKINILKKNVFCDFVGSRQKLGIFLDNEVSQKSYQKSSFISAPKLIF